MNNNNQRRLANLQRRLNVLQGNNNAEQGFNGANIEQGPIPARANNIIELPQAPRSFMNRIRTVKNSAVRFAESLHDLTVGQIRDLMTDPTPSNLTIGEVRTLALWGFFTSAVLWTGSQVRKEAIMDLTKKLAEAQRGAPQLAPAAFKLITNMSKKGGRRRAMKTKRRRN